ncbi:MAG: hypothetical protein JWM80_1446 [Cyanobacteria bacterium RYN_339]|nr:hypothetical protein [Cyanobacteria bacterium RYN_339]
MGTDGLRDGVGGVPTGVPRALPRATQAAADLAAPAEPVVDFNLLDVATNAQVGNLLARMDVQAGNQAGAAALADNVQGYGANLARARQLEAQRGPVNGADVAAVQADLALRQGRDASLRAAAAVAGSPAELREVLLLAPPNLQVELARAALARQPEAKQALGAMITQVVADDGRKLNGTQARLELRALAEDATGDADPSAALQRLKRGISPDQARTDPSARAALRTLARSTDPAIQAALAATVRGWERTLIERRLPEGAQGKPADAVFQEVQDDIAAVAKDVGFGLATPQDLPEAYRDTALNLLNQGLTLDQIKANPALGQLLSQLQFSADPAIKAKLDTAVRGLLKQELQGALDAKLPADKAIARFNERAAELGKLAGLGPQVAAQSQEAVRDKAREILAGNPNLADIEANPAKGALLSTLQGTSDAPQLKAAVQRFSDQALERELKDAHGEGAVKAALGRYQAAMKAFAETNHIGGLADVVKQTVEGHKHTLEDKSNEGKGFLDRIGDFFSGIGNFLVDCVKDLGHFAAEVGHGVVAGVEWVGHEIKEGAQWLGEQAYKHIIDPALTKEIGADKDRGEATGTLGHVLTNRLELGKAAYVHIQAGGKFGPFELAGGGELEIKRVPMTDPHTGLIMYEADGKTPRCEIQVTLVAGAKAGVGIDLEKKTGIVDAKLKAEAGLKVNGVAQFRFDPKDPHAVDDMTDLFKDVGEAAMESAIPGLGLILAARTVERLPDDFQRFTRHMTEYSGQIDVYAGIEAEFKAGPWVNKDDAKKAEERKGIVQKGKAALADALKGQAQVGADVGVGAEAGIGVDEDLRRDTTTVYAHIGGHIEGSVSAGPLGTGRGIGGNRTVAIIYDNKTGEIIGAEVQERISKYSWSGLKLAGGKTLGADVVAKLGQNDAVVVTRQLNPEALARLKKDGPSAMLSIDTARDTDVKSVQTVEVNNHNIDLKLAQIDIGTRDVQSVFSSEPDREQRIYGLYDAMKSDGAAGTTVTVRGDEPKKPEGT